MGPKRSSVAQRQRVVPDEGPRRAVVRDSAAAGLALIRAAAAVLHRQGDLAQITPKWVEAYVRANRNRDMEE